MQPQKSKISNIEWGIIIGALFMIDLVQLVLDLFGVWEWINWLVDVVIQGAFTFYLYMRGEDLGNWKKIASMISTFFLEEVSLGFLPLWGIEGLTMMMLSKAQHSNIAASAGKVAGEVARVSSIASKVALLAGPEAEAVSIVLKKVSTASTKIQQAAMAVERNQLKLSDKPIPTNFANKTPADNIEKSLSVRPSYSPRAAQIKQAASAVVRNNQKVYNS